MDSNLQYVFEPTRAHVGGSKELGDGPATL